MAPGPRVARALVRLCARPEDREFILRDLDERFAEVVDTRGLRQARRWYRAQAASALAWALLPDVAQLRRRSWNAAVRPRQLRDDAWQDLVLALRQLRHAPTFAIAAIATLALAIGANTAVFSVVEGVLLKPLPYGHPDRLAAIWSRFDSPEHNVPKTTLDPREVLNYKEESRAFSSIGAMEAGPSQALTGGGLTAREVNVWLADAALLPTLNVTPILGRWFTKAEDAPGGPAVTVLTHALWASRYGSDPGVVGQTIMMSGVSTEVVGVLPEGFVLWYGGPDHGAYMPLRLTRANQVERCCHLFAAIGRLAPGKTLADVDTELTTLNRRWAQQDPPQQDQLWAQPLKADRLGDASHVLYLFLTAVGLVLLVACVNLANLLLSRGERRRDEIAVRAALGAGQGRIVRQLLAESLALATLAAVVALPLAWIGTKALIGLDPTALPRLGEAHVGGTTLAFTTGLTVLTTLFFGVVPAILTGRRGVASGLGTGRRVTEPQSRSLRQVLVMAELAVSVVVVVLAGLLLRSFHARVSTDPGFRAADVLTFDLTLSASSYPRASAVPLEYERLLDTLRTIPGVESVSGGSAVPFGRHFVTFAFRVDGRPSPRPGDEDPVPTVVTNFVMPDYFGALGIPIQRGRRLTTADDASAPPVGVINATMADRFWPGESAIGKRWSFGLEETTVVGVVRDQLRSQVGEEAMPTAYLPQPQVQAVIGRIESSRALIDRIQRDLTVAMRTAVDPLSVVPAVRAAVHEFDPDLPVDHVRTMSDAVDASFAQPRLAASLLATFALLALLLAMVGLYGVVSYSVASRTSEIGVRVALGASRANIVHLMTGEGVWPAVVGIAIGLAAARFATRLVESMIYGVDPTDTLTFTLLPVALLVVAVAASLVPALRATRIPPTEALRAD